MNYNELNAEIVRSGLSIPKMASVVGIGKKTMYQKMRGERQFKQREILIIKNTLELTSEQVNNIFFVDCVS